MTTTGVYNPEVARAHVHKTWTDLQAFHAQLKTLQQTAGGIGAAELPKLTHHYQTFPSTHQINWAIADLSEEKGQAVADEIREILNGVRATVGEPALPRLFNGDAHAHHHTAHAKHAAAAAGAGAAAASAAAPFPPTESPPPFIGGVAGIYNPATAAEDVRKTWTDLQALAADVKTAAAGPDGITLSVLSPLCARYKTFPYRSQINWAAAGLSDQEAQKVADEVQTILNAARLRYPREDDNRMLLARMFNAGA